MNRDGRDYALQVLDLVRRALASGEGNFGRVIESIDLDGSGFPDTKLIITWRSREGERSKRNFGLWDGSFNNADSERWMAPEAISNMIVTNFDEP